MIILIIFRLVEEEEEVSGELGDGGLGGEGNNIFFLFISMLIVIYLVDLVPKRMKFSILDHA